MLKELIVTVKEFNVGKNQLRAFGVCLSIIFLIFYQFHSPSVLLILFAIAALIVATLAPLQYLPLVKILIAVTFPLGWIISRIILFCFYYVVLTPIGLVIRLFNLRIMKSESYWEDVEQNNHHDRMSL